MTARVLQPTPANIEEAAEVLRRGGLVGLPTETVYGLAGVAFDERAVARIFAAKERPTFDPLIVHVATQDLASGDALDGLARLGVVDPAPLGATARTRVEALAAACWPGPLTLILPRGTRVPELVTSGLPTVAVRVPRHTVAQALLAATGTPLCAPSANRFGRISPTSVDDVVAELGERVELVLDGGRCTIGVESTVVGVAPDGALALLRPGGVPAARLAELAGAPLALPSERRPAGVPVPAPGLLASHYAPRTPLRLLPGPVTSLVAPPAGQLPGHLGLLVFAGDADEAAAALARLTGRRVTARSLSRDGALDEAARNLFASLRALDESPAELLLAEPCPVAEGLGHAIQDRLARASHDANRV